MRQLLIPVLALGFFFGFKLPIPAQEGARGILEKAITGCYGAQVVQS